MEGKSKFQKNVSCLHILKIKVHEGGVSISADSALTDLSNHVISVYVFFSNIMRHYKATSGEQQTLAHCATVTDTDGHALGGHGT